MSIKHVKQYYEEVCNQYHEFVEELKDFERLCNEGMVSPELIDQAKQTIEPLKDNWQKLNYIMFLLNKPNKKDKANAYTKSKKKLLSNSITKDQVITQNEEAISNLKSLKDC